MTRTAGVPSRGPVFHLLRETARPGPILLPRGLPPGAPFPYEAVDDSPGARYRIDSSRCARLAARRREDRERHQTPRHRWVVTGRFCTPLSRTRVGVCGSVRIPVSPGDRDGQDAGAPGHPSFPGAATGSMRPCPNLSPAFPSPRPMPDRFCTRLSRTRDAVCGFVRIQDGPHLSRKDARA